VSFPQPRTPASKLLPPELPPAFLERPALLARLDEVPRRRLTTVVAGAGYGKSTALAAWAAGTRSAWYALQPEDASVLTFARGLADALRLRLPDLPADLASGFAAAPGPDTDEVTRAGGLAAVFGEALERRLDRDLVLILDDVHELPAGGASARLVEGLARHAPAGLHLVLSSRAEPPFPIGRLRGRGQVLEVGGALLGLSEGETAELLGRLLGPGGAELAGRLHALTGGWPAATCLAAEVLRGHPPAQWPAELAALGRPGEPLVVYLAEEVLAHEDPSVRELIRRLAPLRRFTAELCGAVGVDASPAMLARLARRGLFLEPRPAVEGWYALNELVREATLAAMPLPEPDRLRLHQVAAAWLLAGGHREEALASLVEAGDPRATAAFLAEHGPAQLAGGAVAGVVAAAAAVPAPLRTPAVEQVEGEARQIQGDWEGALECFRRAAGGSQALPPGLAWRMGLIHYLRGEVDQALEAYRRGRRAGTGGADEALLDAWTAAAHWLRGEVDACREAAGRALRAATACADDRALAAAHTAMAMLAAFEGDRAGNDVHSLRALEAAERAGDVLQAARIRANRGSRGLEEGDYQEALAELEIAIRLAELSGFAAILALAVSNRGEAHLGLGRLDEAIADFELARATYQRIGSRNVAYPTDGLGIVYRERGDLALAGAAHQEAVRLAEEAGDVQGLVPALAGLARVLAADDPERAAKVAEEALARGPGMGWVAAQLAAGWVALARGERELAAGHAAGAAAAAASRRDRPGLAEALELRALAAADPRRELARLREAGAIWETIGNPLGAARNALAAARLAGDEAAAAGAEERLRALGVRAGAGTAAGLLLAVATPARDPVRVQALGGFRVLRDGQPVPTEQWQSRKARDLLKFLVARRGRATTREQLMEALWPDEDSGRLANRLSVALSTVRAVLDPDHRFPGDRFVVADKHVVALAGLPVDVEEFLAAATAGLDRHARGDGPEAVAQLAAAESAYAGDFLEEDPYEDWAVPLREQARAAYLAVARTLAGLAAAGGRHDLAVRYHLRVLERDPYDEEAHLGLVATMSAAGRHGEARRRYRLYAGRMAELDVEAAPFPARGAQATFSQP
jgi:DNA-binding SARP family transcriptional activator